MLRREAPVADVRRRILAALDASHDAPHDARPCECVFKKPRKGQRGQRWQPQCDCEALPGEGHALHCARVWGEQESA